MLRMLLAPCAPGRFPFVVVGARLVVRPLCHQSPRPQPPSPPALVMRRVAIGVPPEAGLAIPHGRGLEERITRRGAEFARPRPTAARGGGRGRLGGEARVRGSHRNRGVEAKASPLARSDSDRAEVARMLVDDGAAHAEKTSELL